MIQLLELAVGLALGFVLVLGAVAVLGMAVRTLMYPFEWVAYWLGKGDHPSYWEMAHSWTFDGPWRN